MSNGNTRAMYDSVTASRLPKDAVLVGAYVDGHYENLAEVKKQCPKARIVTITPHGKAGAHVADCETGDLTPEEAAVWAAAEVKAGRKPTIYMNASTWNEVKRHVDAHGLTGKVSYWVAHYDNVASIPPGAVAKQYIERKDQNLDYSIAAAYWPGVDPEPVKDRPAPKPAPAHTATTTPHPSWWTHVVHKGEHDQSVASALKVLDNPDYPPTQVTIDDRVANLLGYIQHHIGEQVTGALTANTANAIAHWHDKK